MKEQVKQYSLKNGLSCCYRNMDPFVDFVTMALVVKAGSMMEEEGKKGTAHVLEHLLMSFWTFGLCKDIDFRTKAHTDFHDTIFYVQCPTHDDNLLSCIKILFDIASGKFLDEKYFCKAKNDVLREIKDEKDNNIIAKILLQKSFYSKCFTLGEEKDVKNMPYSDVLSFYNKFYSPENMSLEIVGDIGDVEKLHRNIEIIFGDITPFKVEYKYKKVYIPEYTGEVCYIDQKNQKNNSQEKNINIVVRYEKSNPISNDLYIKEEIIEKIAFTLLIEEIKNYFRMENMEIKYNIMELDASYIFYSIEIFGINSEDVLCEVNSFFDDYDISQSNIDMKICEVLKDFHSVERNNVEYYEKVGMHQLLLECIDNFTMQKPIISYDERCNLYEKVSEEIQVKEVIEFISKFVKSGKFFLIGR